MISIEEVEVDGPTLRAEDIPSYAPVYLCMPNGSRIKVDVVGDDGTMGAPWEEHDGHGIVSEWTQRLKQPGEMVLASDRGSYRYYDFAGTVKIARRDGWGVEGKTPGERAHRAALEDFKRLQAWCNDEWQWVGVVVTLETPGEDPRMDSLWGIESDGDYWREIAAELGNGLLGAKNEPSVPHGLPTRGVWVDVRERRRAGTRRR